MDKRTTRWTALLWLLSSCSTPPIVSDDGALRDAASDAANPGRDVANDVVVDVALSDAASDVTAAPSCGSCAAYGATDGLGRLRSMEMRETSGLVASQVHEDIFWAHNDSGDAPRLFAIRSNGTLVGEYAIHGASAVDWEDIGVGPCADGPGSCIVLADVGDNPSTRTSVELYRVREPAMLEASGALEATRFQVRYPMGAMNCEAMVVDRRDGSSALLIEKSNSAQLRLVRVSLAGAGGAQMAEELGTIAGFGALVTGADSHPCEPAIIVRTYASAWEMRGVRGDSLDRIARATRVERATAAEVQGEAIAYTANGRGYVTTSEGMYAMLTAVYCQ